jgi:hypothetical protein
MSFSVRHSLFLLVTALLLGLGGLACGGSGETTDIVTDDSEGPIPSPQDAQDALNEALQAFNEYCVAPRAQGRENEYPLALFNPDSNASSFRYRQLRALAQVGLLERYVEQDDQQGLPIHRFALTKKGRQARYDIAQARAYVSRFCYATPEVTRIDSIKSVYTSDPDPLANVWFSYTYQDLQPWAESREVQRVFRGLRSRPSRTDTIRTEQLLIRVDSAWVDRRLTGYERPPSRPSP